MSKRSAKPLSVEEQREEARAMAARSSGETSSVVALATGRLAYAITGRRRDGTFRGNGRLRWFLRTILATPFIALWALVGLLIGVFLDPMNSPELPSKRKNTVQGGESCAALSLAEALRTSDGTRWIAWSRHHVSLIAVLGGEARVVWSGSGEQRPKLKVSGNTPSLRWPDDSRVDLVLSESEKARISTTHGAP